MIASFPRRGGYRREAVAGIIQGTASRVSRIDSGHTDGCATQLDFTEGWGAVNHTVRRILSQFVDNGDKVPIGETDALLAKIEEAKRTGEATAHLSATIRRTRAVDSLAGAMSWNRPAYIRRHVQPFVVIAGPAHRGSCVVCGAWCEDREVWRDPASPRVWCFDHGAEIAA